MDNPGPPDGSRTTAKSSAPHTVTATRLRARPGSLGTGQTTHSATARANATGPHARSGSTGMLACGTDAARVPMRATADITKPVPRQSASAADPLSGHMATPTTPSTSAPLATGTARMLAIGATSETVENAAATTGTVDTWAMAEAPAAADIRRHPPPRADATQAPAQPEKSNSPPTAATDSRRESPYTTHGLATIIAQTAAPNAASPEPRLPDRPATVTTVTMPSARRVDVCQPVIQANAAASASAAIACVPLPAPSALHPREPASTTIPRWRPETASRCDNPAMRKSRSVSDPTSRLLSASSIPDRSAPPGPSTPASSVRNPSRSRVIGVVIRSAREAPASSAS